MLFRSNAMEGKQLSDEEGYDNYLIGGGLFTTAILTGVLTIGKFSGKSKVVTAEMKTDPYHPDWKNYTGKDRGVGADVVKDNNQAKNAGSASKLNQGEQRAVSKIDNILNNFKDSDITGTLKDMAGNPVPKPTGGYWDHLKEMNDTLRGLRNHAETLKNVNDPAAQAARNRALDTIQRIESALNGAGI